jgi:WD40 repeat protein
MTVSAPSAILSLSTDEYGHQVAVSTLSNGISVFSVPHLSPAGAIPATDSTPLSIAYSSAEFGSLVAAGFSDGTVRVYDNFREVKRFEPRKAAVLSIAFHPSQPSIAAASLDGTFTVYTRSGGDWSATSVVASFLGLSAIAWAFDRDRIQTLVIGTVDGTIHLYNSVNGRWEFSRSVPVHNGWVRRISVPKAVISDLKIATVGDDDFAAVITFAATGPKLVKITGDSPPTDLSWALLDKVIVISHANGPVSFWKEDGDNQWNQTSE